MKRIKHPSEVVAVGDEVDVKVLKFTASVIVYRSKAACEDPDRN